MLYLLINFFCGYKFKVVDLFPIKPSESKAKDLSRCKDWFQMYCVLPPFFGQKSGDGHEVFRQRVSCLNSTL